MDDLIHVNFDVETRTVSLSDTQCTLVADCLRHVMDDETRKSTVTALFDIFHGKEGSFTLTIRKWLEVEHAVLALQGFLQETLSYETFPERHQRFEELHRLIDGETQGSST